MDLNNEPNSGSSGSQTPTVSVGDDTRDDIWWWYAWMTGDTGGSGRTGDASRDDDDAGGSGGTGDAFWDADDVGVGTRDAGDAGVPGDTGDAGDGGDVGDAGYTVGAGDAGGL
ncbi:uncharacterized PE-PGRS family protein PE_PGRS20-like [Salvia splendens]|uniref:uncharacterized PE-PGRS family protein PE_PGRS20-like n=1 Tax=Salvia splendens TaxID=180675 RepID=UPI001C25225F|nr:uncharacterized PE-PGRS family protein PE_PGRS20-like [Salvia splendens]